MAFDFVTMLRPRDIPHVCKFRQSVAKLGLGKSLAAFPEFTASGQAAHTLNPVGAPHMVCDLHGRLRHHGRSRSTRATILTPPEMCSPS
jgi:hypothetical protein